MMYREKDEFDEHDHNNEVICSWDEEKEAYKQLMTNNFVKLKILIKNLEERIEKLEGDKK